jgi:hypothetical protein
MNFKNMYTINGKEDFKSTSRMIYGLIIIQSVLIYLWIGNKDVSYILISLISSLFMIALAEIYVSGIILSAQKKSIKFNWTYFKEIILEEISVFRFAIIPLLLFILSLFNIISLNLAFWLSYFVGLIALALIGYAHGAYLKKPFLLKIGLSLLNIFLGGVLIFIKVIFH